MTAYVIDGKAIAAKVRADVAADVALLKRSTASCPASPWCWSARIPRARSTCATRPRRPSRPACSRSSTSSGRDRPSTTLLALVAKLNADPDVNGILVQLPLPKHMDSDKVLELDRPATRTSTASTR